MASAEHGERSVMFLITGLGVGGAERQVASIAVGLQKRGWDVSVCSMLSATGDEFGLAAAGIPVLSLRMRRGVPNPLSILHLRTVVGRKRPAILHSHMVHANLLARVTRPVLPVRVCVCTAHSINEGGALREIAYRLTDRFADRTTIISSTAAARYADRGIVAKSRLLFIPNGVDVGRFAFNPGSRAAMRTELKLGDGFIWLAVGRLEPVKDYKTMLSAFADVVNHRREPILLIAGDGPLRREVEGIVHRLGIESRVRFLGIREDIPAIMSACDGFVMSSRWEGMPMVLLEATASSLPVVATAVGGNHEIVEDGVTGHLVPPGEPSKLAFSLRQVMEASPSRIQQLGKNARERTTALYGLDRILNRWEGLYQALLVKQRS